jgi:hypothetical protein
VSGITDATTNTPCGSNLPENLAPIRSAAIVPMERAETLDEAAISRLREFFELLDRWDREYAKK